MLDYLSAAFLALVAIGAGIELRRRRTRADEQYDLRFPVISFARGDEREEVRADFALMLLLVETSSAATGQVAWLFDLRRVNGSHWERREQDASRARTSGAVELDAWHRVDGELASRLEADYARFVATYDARGPWGLANPVTGAVVDAERRHLSRHR